jgi:Spy/CpxP family protein refolding chaperone
MRTVLLLLLSLSFTAPAWAGRGAEDAAKALTSNSFDDVAAELALSDTQRTQVSDAIYASNSARVDLDARAQKARLQVRHLLAADPIDEKAVLKAVDALSAAEAEVRKNRVQLLLDIRETLTPEQWRKLLELRKERRASSEEE